MDERLKTKLRALAGKYETAAFLRDDPSQFMHRYATPAEQERAAFVASALSYGSRAQFLPKIDFLLAGYMQGKPAVPNDDRCFYRLHTNRMVRRFLQTLDTIYRDYGSMKSLVSAGGARTGSDAVKLLTAYFAAHAASDLVPRNPASACKRLCMFLRWMVRDNSPVDLGLWSAIIDKATLIMPLDTHVVSEARRMGLLTGGAATMAAAKRLTAAMAECFPGDPLRGDFALFGLGVDEVFTVENGRFC
ncbi:MAG: TIGR02757 family protein [Prevotella sp.]|nr:TIGR02757 family protein [Prevotella sp.]